jgi:hypothetical protein
MLHVMEGAVVGGVLTMILIPGDRDRRLPADQGER